MLVWYIIFNNKRLLPLHTHHTKCMANKNNDAFEIEKSNRQMSNTKIGKGGWHVVFYCLLFLMLCASCHDDAQIIIVNEESVCYAQLDDTTLFVHPFVHEGQRYVVAPSYWDMQKLAVVKGENKADVKVVKSKLPTIFIRTESGSMDHINASKKNEEAGHIIVVDTLGIVEYDGELESMHGRGNWTWWQNKKPYTIKLANKVKMLGLKKAKKFSLLSEVGDPTGLRNWMALSAAKQMGLNDQMEFSYANVYLNGNYAGCYLVTNKIDRKPRHDFLLEIDIHAPGKEDAAFPLTHRCYMTIKKPKHSTAGQLAYIEKEWRKVKEALSGRVAGNGANPIDSLIDMDTFVSNYLCQEVFKNMDAGFASFYLGKDSLGRFYADPLWDMDMTMSSPSSTLFGHDLCRVIYAGAGFSPDSTGYAGIWGMLYKNSAFRHQVSSAYFSSMKPILQELFWGDTWTSIHSYLAADMEMDNLRWRNGAGFESQCDQMRHWMEEKLRYLDDAWNEDAEVSKCIVTLRNSTRHPLLYVVPKNTKFSEQLPGFDTVRVLDTGYEYTFLGYEIDGYPVDLDTLVVRNDITICGRWKQTQTPSLLRRLRLWFWNLRH